MWQLELMVMKWLLRNGRYSWEIVNTVLMITYFSTLNNKWDEARASLNLNVQVA